VSIAIAFFTFAVVWLVTFAFGLIVEFVAGRFLSQETARFGGFCFVAGLVVSGWAKTVSQINEPQTAVRSSAAIVALLCLAWRAFGERLRRREIH